MGNPCKGCGSPKRHIGCHGECPERKIFVEQEEARKLYERACKTGWVDPVEFEKRHKPIKKY